MTYIFVPFAFLFSSLMSVKLLCIFGLIAASSSIVFYVIAFSCNVKSYAIVFLFFLTFLFLLNVFGWTAKSFLANVCYHGGVWPKSGLFPGNTEKYFRKGCSYNYYSWCVWHMTRLIDSNQHSQDPKKHKKWPQKTRKQVSQHKEIKKTT